MVAALIQQPGRPAICFIPKYICAKYELRFFQIAELLYNFLVAMATVFPERPGRPVLPVMTKNICAKFEPKMLSLN